MKKKLFRRCPFDNRETCVGCKNHTHCVMRKIRRKIKRNFLSIILLFLAIIAIAALMRLKLNAEEVQQPVAILQQNVSIEVVTISIDTVEEKEHVVLQVETKEEITETKTTEKTTGEVKEEPIEEVAVISAYGPSDTYYYQVTSEEKIALTKLVYQESRGEPFEGQVAVAATVLNRYTSKSSDFDTRSILTVITQPYQFADISGVTQEQLDSVPSCERAVEAALKGWDPTRVEFKDGAKYFYEPTLVSGHQKEIREGIHTYKIGNHSFHEDFNK